MIARFLQSLLVGLGAAFLAVLLCLFGLQIYVRYLVVRQPGIGAVAGGVGPSLFVMAIVFCIAFLWNWRRGR